MPFSLNGKILFSKTLYIYTWLYISICVAVTPYIFGCSSMFSKISVANIS